jgi:RNA polymerase sigma factor (sigma-70 family)
MDQLIKIVRTYRLTGGVAERVRLAEEICRQIAPDLRFFVFGFVPPSDADDVLQNTIKGIIGGLRKFEGDSAKQFWAWCYRIARNKICDHFREKAADRVRYVPSEELHRLVEQSARDAPMSPAVRLDLEYAMKVLTASKPECYEFLWQHYIFGLDYAEIAEERTMTYDNVRMKIGRCLDEARRLVK